jgi:hypothetical protein
METTFPIGNVLSKLTPEAVKKIASDQLARDRELQARDKARRESNEAPKFAPIVYADADEASRAYQTFMVQPDEEAKLKDANERLFELHEKEDAMCAVLADNPTTDERRTLLGYEAPVMPELPGIARQLKHVPGTLEIIRERIATLEAQLPLLKIRAAQYAHVRDSFKAWPVSRINRERNARVERQMIVAGKSIQKRGQQ